MNEQKGRLQALQTEQISVSLPASLVLSEPHILYKPKDTIFRQGDPCGSIFYVEEGQVQISVISAQGKEGVIASLGAGDYFGEESLADHSSYLATASVISSCRVVKIGKLRMIAALRQHPDFAERFIAFLLLRNAQIQADLVDQLFNSTEKRLARSLLRLANFGAEGRSESVVPRISQETLAARIGTTRSRVNYFLTKFRRLGFIEQQGRHFKINPSLVDVLLHGSSKAFPAGGRRSRKTRLR